MCQRAYVGGRHALPPVSNACRDFDAARTQGKAVPGRRMSLHRDPAARGTCCMRPWQGRHAVLATAETGMGVPVNSRIPGSRYAIRELAERRSHCSDVTGGRKPAMTSPCRLVTDCTDGAHIGLLVRLRVHQIGAAKISAMAEQRGGRPGDDSPSPRLMRYQQCFWTSVVRRSTNCMP